MDKIYVRFVRYYVSGEHELLVSTALPIAAIPRQGEWIELKATRDLTHHTCVKKVTWHLVAGACHNDPGLVEYVELLVG